MSNGEGSSKRPLAGGMDIGAAYWIALVAILVMVASILSSVYFYMTRDGGRETVASVSNEAALDEAITRKVAAASVHYPNKNPLIYHTSSDGSNPGLGTTTKDGFRPPSISNLGPKKKGERRILVVGDSNTYGLGIADGSKIYTGVLGALMKEAGLDITVVNISASGYNVTNSMEAISSYFGLVEPDFVIYQYQSNDQYLSVYPYGGTFATVWNFEQFLMDTPAYTETSLYKIYSTYPNLLKTNDLNQAYSWHPIFRPHRLKLFGRLKRVSESLARAKIPFAVFQNQPFPYVETTLEEALSELGVQAELWLNTFDYKQAPLAPYHPDEEGHRVLAYEIYYALKRHETFSDLPELTQATEFAESHLRILQSPADLRKEYEATMAKYREDALTRLDRMVAFPPETPRGLLQFFGHVTPRGYGTYKVALLMPPTVGDILNLEFDMPNSPMVLTTPITLRMYDEGGTLLETTLQGVRRGSNEISLSVPNSPTASVFEFDFKNVYYSRGVFFPISVRFKRVFLTKKGLMATPN